MNSPTPLSTRAEPSASPPPAASAPHTGPPRDPLRRPVPRQFLERVSRPLLARLLSDHAPVLESQHSFPLATLAASAQTDRAQVEALWQLLSAAPAELAPLREDLLSVADVATPSGHEALLFRDSARVLDHELGAEDCAALARLEHRPLFDSVRPQAAGQAQTKSFASFQTSSAEPLPDDPACAVAFRKQMSAELVKRGRSDYFKVHEWRSGSERHLELVYGRLASARDLIGKTKTAAEGASHDLTAQVTDRSSERAHAIFHDDTLRLELAGPDWIKELVRRVFGEAYFGSAAHFEGTETLTLDPLLDLAAALSVEGIPGLKKVELQELWFDLDGKGGWVGVGARGDCVIGAPAAYIARGLADGKPADAIFHLVLAGRTRPIKLKLCLPRRIEFDRRDPRVVRIVRDWLVGRRFMRMQDHAPEVLAGAETVAATLADAQ
jgi:hypothetical protein